MKCPNCGKYLRNSVFEINKKKLRDDRLCVKCLKSLSLNNEDKDLNNK